MKLFGRKPTKPSQSKSQLPANFDPNKQQLIDYVNRNCHPTPSSFADLGGVWDVDGAYTFYTLDEYPSERAFIIDTDFTEATRAQAQRHPQLRLIEGNFGEEATRERIGQVDAIYMFNVLLHQVKPDWDEVLALYAKHTQYFLIFNQQWTGPESVRLLDLGREEYFKNVPHAADEPPYDDLFEKLDRKNPQHDRLWRDVHNIWQWGIIDRDLVQALEGLGFKMQFYKNCGRFDSLPNCENHSFVFQKI